MEKKNIFYSMSSVCQLASVQFKKIISEKKEKNKYFLMDVINLLDDIGGKLSRIFLTGTVDNDLKNIYIFNWRHATRQHR